MDQSDMRFLRRKTEQNSYETIIRASVGKHAYIRIGTYYMYSRSSIANNFWHNVKYFYNARESRYDILDNAGYDMVYNVHELWIKVEGSVI